VAAADLLRLLPRGDAVAWVRRGAGLAGRGEAARIMLPAGQDRFTAGEKWLRAMFETAGYYPLSQGVIPWMGHMILPWITLATVQAAVYTRLSRGSLLDTLGEDYIRTARAKGLSETRVIYRHGLRAALTR
jgi:hypothetical protein